MVNFIAISALLTVAFFATPFAKEREGRRTGRSKPKEDAPTSAVGDRKETERGKAAEDGAHSAIDGAGDGAAALPEQYWTQGKTGAVGSAKQPQDGGTNGNSARSAR